MSKKKRGLGKGLDALFEDAGSDVKNALNLPIKDIETSKNQPRKHFDEESMQTLAESIRAYGILQPIVVRSKIGGGYQIVAGERRWRAAKELGLAEVPVIIKEIGDLEAAQIALVENLQRENLNPIEEASGYKDLMTAFDMSQEEISQKVGKSRPAVANSLRLLNLPAALSELVKSEKISAGHARTLLGLKNRDIMTDLANKIVDEGLSVRETENIVKNQNTRSVTLSADETAPQPPQNIIGGETFYIELETALKNELGRKVKIEHSGSNKGHITVSFYSKEEARDIAEKLSR